MVVFVLVFVVEDIDAVAVVGVVDLMVFFEFLVDGIIFGRCCNR